MASPNTLAIPSRLLLTLSPHSFKATQRARFDLPATCGSELSMHQRLDLTVGDPSARSLARILGRNEFSGRRAFDTQPSGRVLKALSRHPTRVAADLENLTIGQAMRSVHTSELRLLTAMSLHESEQAWSRAEHVDANQSTLERVGDSWLSNERVRSPGFPGPPMPVHEHVEVIDILDLLEDTRLPVQPWIRWMLSVLNSCTPLSVSVADRIDWHIKEVTKHCRSPEAARQALSCRLQEGHSSRGLRQLASEHGLSHQRLFQLERAVLDRLAATPTPARRQTEPVASTG